LKIALRIKLMRPEKQIKVRFCSRALGLFQSGGKGRELEILDDTINPIR